MWGVFVALIHHSFLNRRQLRRISQNGYPETDETSKGHTLEATSPHVDLRRSREIRLMVGIRSTREAPTEVSRSSNERQVR